MVNHPNRARARRANVSPVAAATPTPAPTPPTPSDRRTRRDRLEQHYRRTHDADFAALVAALGPTVAASGDGPLYVVDVPRGALFATFVERLPALRRVHTCSCCRSFLNRYGAFARLTPSGEVRSALWGDPERVPPVYRDAVRELRRRVEGGRVADVFTGPEPRWGVARAGGFDHLTVDAPAAGVAPWRVRVSTRTPNQERAQLRVDHEALRAALRDANRAGLELLIELLRRGEVDRSELFLGPVGWFAEQRDRVEREPNPLARDHKLWRAVATAPAEGYLHPRQAVWWDLHEELGSSRRDVVAPALRRFAARTHGLTYQRPKAAPRAGQLDRAEQLFAQLALAPALRRRYAQPEEVTHNVWAPPAAERPASELGDRVFDHLRSTAADARAATAPSQTVTWSRFARLALPTAEALEVRAPARGSYFMFTTAVDPTAPPLLYWDRPDMRNPVAHYFWAGGSSAADFSLTAGAWVTVRGVTREPATWRGDPGRPVPERVFLVLAGARDQRLQWKGGLALFPENLRPELREVRAVIEAHSNRSQLEPVAGPVAGGISVGHHAGVPFAPLTVRVRARGLTTTYELTGWD